MLAASADIGLTAHAVEVSPILRAARRRNHYAHPRALILLNTP